MSLAMHLAIRVIPRAKRAGLEQGEDGTWVARVTAPAEGGRANDALIALLAQHVHLPQRDVTIVHGYTSRRKLIEIPG